MFTAHKINSLANDEEQRATRNVEKGPLYQHPFKCKYNLVGTIILLIIIINLMLYRVYMTLHISSQRDCNWWSTHREYTDFSLDCDQQRTTRRMLKSRRFVGASGKEKFLRSKSNRDLGAFLSANRLTGRMGREIKANKRNKHDGSYLHRNPSNVEMRTLKRTTTTNQGMYHFRQMSSFNGT